jgi:acetyltransferase-like isoleucine patch superfamily enzyme
MSAAVVVREGLKRAARLLATAAVLPLWLAFFLPCRALAGRDRAVESFSEAVSLLPGLSGRYLRRAFLALVLDECHPSATVCFGVLFSKAGARVGPNTYVGPRCHLGLVTLERDVLLAAGVHVTSGAHTHGVGDPSRPIREQQAAVRRVHVGAGAWVGSAAVVMNDVGAGSVVGAGAVVTRPVPDGVVAAGVPAAVIRAVGAGVRDGEEAPPG